MNKNILTFIQFIVVAALMLFSAVAGYEHGEHDAISSSCCTEGQIASISLQGDTCYTCAEIVQKSMENGGLMP